MFFVKELIVSEELIERWIRSLNEVMSILSRLSNVGR